MQITKKHILKIEKSIATTKDDVLAIEEPLQISLSGKCIKTPTGTKTIAITMRTPGSDAELAAGFLYGEGILSSADQIVAIHNQENKVGFEISELLHPLSKLKSNFYTTSSCGVCGKASIEALQFTTAPPVPIKRWAVKPRLINGLTTTARKAQQSFQQTGGIHAATLFDLSGSIVYQYEDVGRHNALDKVVGSAYLKGKLPLEEHLLLLSGRASFELIQKSVMAGIQLVVAIGAPSSLAVELADEYDLTLIGFLRDESFNVYTGKQRLELTRGDE